MRAIKRWVVVSVLLAASTAPLGAPAGAAGYDNSNPSSTGCANKGPLEVPSTARTFGVWSVRLRRSTGCNTVWAIVSRTDTKKCQLSGANCAQIRITRVRSDGTKSSTSWRKMPHGTKSVLSLQLNAVGGASYTAKFSTFGGTSLGTSGTLVL